MARSRPRSSLSTRYTMSAARYVGVPPGVVVVVRAGHVMPGELEQARDGVAVGAVASRRDDDRSCRVRGDHLDLDALTRVRPAAAVPLVDLCERVEVEAVADTEVQEPRPRDFGRLDPVELDDLLRQLLPEAARRPPDLLRGTQSDVRSKLPVRLS